MTTVLAALPAYAAPPTNDAEWQKLYEDALALLDKGKAAEACGMLSEAVRYRAGSGVLLALGQCHAATGRFVQARARYQQALEAASKATKDREAKERMAREGLAAVDARIARIEVQLSPTAPAGAAVMRDGEPVAPGSVVMADPGTVVFEVTAPGCEAARVNVTVKEGERVSKQVSPGVCGGGDGAGNEDKAGGEPKKADDTSKPRQEGRIGYELRAITSVRGTFLKPTGGTSAWPNVVVAGGGGGIGLTVARERGEGVGSVSLEVLGQIMTGSIVSATQVDFGISGGYVGSHLGVATPWGKTLFLSGVYGFLGATHITGGGNTEDSYRHNMTGWGFLAQARLNALTLSSNQHFTASLQATTGIGFVPELFFLKTNGKDKSSGMVMPAVGAAITVAFGTRVGPSDFAALPATGADHDSDHATPKRLPQQRSRFGYEFRPIFSLGWTRPRNTGSIPSDFASFSDLAFAEGGGAIGLTVGREGGQGVGSVAVEVVVQSIHATSSQEKNLLVNWGISGGYVGAHLAMDAPWGSVLFLSGGQVFLGASHLSGVGGGFGSSPLSGVGVTSKARINLVTLTPNRSISMSLQLAAGVSFVPDAWQLTSANGTIHGGFLAPTIGGAISVSLGSLVAPDR